MQGGQISYVTRVIRGNSCMMLTNFDEPPDTKQLHELLDGISVKERVTPCDYHILFQHDDEWNGFIYATDQIVVIGERGWLQAAIKMIMQ